MNPQSEPAPHFVHSDSERLVIRHPALRNALAFGPLCAIEWIGLDRFVLRNSWTPHHFGSFIGRITRHRTPVPAVAL